MKRIVHLSDLHFGTTSAVLVDALADGLRRLDSDLIIVSGDLTQRARPQEFKQARVFLDALPAPSLVVPGNHDIAPLTSPLERAIRPFERYQRALGRPLEEQFEDQELTVFGLNTVAPFRIKDGRLGKKRLGDTLERLRCCRDTFRVLVAHHGPELIRSRSSPERQLARAIARAGVDLYLCGHGHRTERVVRTHQYEGLEVGFVELAIGTTTSARLRNEPNAFALLELRNDAVDVETHHYDGCSFFPVQRHRYVKSGSTWLQSDRSQR